MEAESLLEDPTKPSDHSHATTSKGSSSTVWNTLTNLWSSGNNEDAIQNQNKEDEYIHVFSLATGHMYERLLRIMMLSVTKRASMKVKVN